MEHNDDQKEIVSPNYNVRTTAFKEWLVVQNQKLPETKEEHPRELKDTNKLIEKYGLRKAEVFAVVLYTGPMVCALLCVAQGRK